MYIYIHISSINKLVRFANQHKTNAFWMSSFGNGAELKVLENGCSQQMCLLFEHCKLGVLIISEILEAIVGHFRSCLNKCVFR